MRLFSLLTLLRLVLCKHLRSIKWQYNVFLLCRCGIERYCSAR
jgi:hypothetical protein